MSIHFQDFQITASIHQNSHLSIYRAFSQQKQQEVVLKVIKTDTLNLEALNRYTQEYNLLHSLELPGIIKTYAIEESEQFLSIISEDIGGESLHRLKAKNSPLIFSPPEIFFPLALAITDSLGQIHHTQIIHNNINLHHIIFNPTTQQVQIIEFKDAVPFNTKNLVTRAVILGSTSPEQRGWISQAVDYRSDFYALGVAFYQLLTGELPFADQDPSALREDQIPPLPHERNPDIAPMLSEIVMKLMAKNPDQRYQSARGIKADLERCYQQWQNREGLASFSLGTKDISPRLEITNKLYGREAELATLQATFERVSTQQIPELLLVAGYSGVGKSTFVKSLSQAVVSKQGHFISGKFNKQKQSYPYSGIKHGFGKFIKQLLKGKESEIEQWRNKLQTALGNQAQVIINFIPEVKLILGEQPKVLVLGVAEAKNRLHILFQKFLNVLFNSEHPLVIFVDNLQWADIASLDLLTQILESNRQGALLVVGTYRDDEVDSQHILSQTLAKLQAEAIAINQINLQTLALSSVTNLLGDTLNSELAVVEPLGKILLKKTGGNPLFLREFLAKLEQEKLLTFVPPYELDQLGFWQWSLVEIEALKLASDVIYLLIEKLKELSDLTRKTLYLASCLDSEFDLNTLAIISENSVEQTFQALESAKERGLIVLKSELDLPLSQYQYEFRHNRIQQAAREFIKAEEKQAISLKIGRLLLRNLNQDMDLDKQFIIVNNLNLCLDSLNDQAECLQLAELNLKLGTTLKLTAAYQAAFNYFYAGIQILGDTAWQKHYLLMLNLHIGASESACFSTQFEVMESLNLAVRKHAKDLLDEVKIYQFEIQSYTVRGQLQQSVETALEILNKLGLSFPKHPKKIDLTQALWSTKLALLGKDGDDLKNLPTMTDPYKLAVMEVGMTAICVFYCARPDLFPLLVTKMVNLSVKHGNTDISAFAYATYGATLCRVSENYKDAYAFGDLALELLSLFQANHLKSRIFWVVINSIQNWRVSIRDLLPFLKAGYDCKSEIGDLIFAGYCIHQYLFNLLWLGEPLEKLSADLKLYNSSLRKLKQIIPLVHNEICLQFILNLKGENGEVTHLVGDSYDEEKMLPQHLKDHDSLCLMYVYYYKLVLSYLFGDYSAAIEYGIKAKAYIKISNGTTFKPLLQFYCALAHFASYQTSSLTQRREIWREVKTARNKFRKWADLAPDNQLQRFYIIEAERYRILARYEQGLEYYEKAIAIAKTQTYLHEEALAYELAGKCCLEWQKPLLAKTYFGKAISAYSRWGAIAKVKDLETKTKNLPIVQ